MSQITRHFRFESSSQIENINTHKGKFTVKRLTSQIDPGFGANVNTLNHHVG